jgi:hypothetical protein
VLHFQSILSNVNLAKHVTFRSIVESGYSFIELQCNATVTEDVIRYRVKHRIWWAPNRTSFLLIADTREHFAECDTMSAARVACLGIMYGRKSQSLRSLKLIINTRGLGAGTNSLHVSVHRILQAQQLYPSQIKSVQDIVKYNAPAISAFC